MSNYAGKLGKRFQYLYQGLSALNVRVERPPLPRHIQLELTTSCNFNCVTCSRKGFNPSRLNRNMTLEELKTILKGLPDIKMIQLQGEGEPFLNPHLPQLLEYCKSRGIKVSTTTNGSLIEKHIDLLKYFYRIYFSIDSADPETFEKIRLGGSFQKTANNIKLAVEERNKNKYKQEIMINSVISHLNFEEIPRLVELAISVGLDETAFVEVENWEVPGEKGYAAEREFIMKAREKSKEMEAVIKSTREKYPNINIIYTSSGKIKKKCVMPFSWSYITVDGFVTPCCHRVNPEVINFGNVYETPFREIWNSEKFVTFRKSMIKDLPNPICDECPD